MRKSRWLVVLGILAAGYFSLQGPSDAHIRSRIVRIESSEGMCSGEQVRSPSGQDYILTAGHCEGLKGPDGTYEVKTEDGKILHRKEIAEDPNSDLLLIEGLPGLKGLDIASGTLPGEKVRTFTHGRNMDTYSTEGNLVQFLAVDIPLFGIDSDASKAKCLKYPKYKLFDEFHLCALHVIEEVSTAMITPGSSGGAVVDSSGDLVGVASASDGVAFFYFVTLSDIQAFLHNY